MFTTLWGISATYTPNSPYATVQVQTELTLESLCQIVAFMVVIAWFHRQHKSCTLTFYT